MLKIIKESLERLSKEQLMIIIDDWRTQLGCISKVCVEESKCHMEAKEAVQQIRDCLCDTDRYNIFNENLGACIDMWQGKITPDKYRAIMLGEDK